MNQWTARLYKLDGSAPQIIPPGSLIPKTLSWQAVGGCDTADLEFIGSEESCLTWLALLRLPIDLYDSRGQKSWWGYIHEIKVQIGAITIGLSLESMSNKVRVTYGSGSNTTWASDTTSQALYGIKEFSDSISDTLQTTAETRRATILAAVGFPIKSFDYQQGNMADQAVKVTIACRGWFSTLDWRYRSETAITQTNIVESGIDWYSQQNFGAQSTYDRLAQGITVGGDTYPSGGTQSFYLDTLGFNIWASGGGLESTLTLRNVAAGNHPGDTIYATGTIAAGNYMDVKFADMTPKYLMVNGATYFIVISATSSGFGAYNSSHVDLRGTGCQVDNDVAWIDRPVAARLSYRLTGTIETTTQISDAALNAVAGTPSLDAVPAITSCEILNASGKYANAYYDGFSTVRSVVETLLKNGTTSNRRLLAYVSAERVLRIYEEPAATRSAATLRVDRTGKLWQSPQAPLVESPVGKWCLVSGLALPATLTDPLLFFIESASFDCEQNAWSSITPRDVESAWRVGGITNK